MLLKHMSQRLVLKGLALFLVANAKLMRLICILFLLLIRMGNLREALNAYRTGSIFILNRLYPSHETEISGETGSEYLRGNQKESIGIERHDACRREYLLHVCISLSCILLAHAKSMSNLATTHSVISQMLSKSITKTRLRKHWLK